MRCVQMQEMPPNPTHWTFSGLLFCFFRYVSPPHRWQLLSGGIMFSGSLILVLFFSVGIKDGLCFCGHRSEVSWLRGLCSDAWCWTVMSHPSLAPVLCQRLSLLHNKYFKKMHQEKVRGQGHYDLTPVSFLWVKYLKNASRKFQYMTQHPLKLKDDLVWFRQSKIKVTVTSHPTYSTKKKTNFYNKRLTG